MAQKFDELLNELAGEIKGYGASALVGVDGINLASHTSSKFDPEAISAQMTLLFKLVDSSVTKLNAGILDDNLTITERAYVLMRFLPGKKYFLVIVGDPKAGNLGNMRLISKMYIDRFANAMPR
jgi:predicted regulator of Ras-like GTPase activity (Roadblock/LC7/MglB family)